MAKKFNKKNFNVEDLAAYKQAYGGVLDRRDYMKYVFLPGLGCLFYATIVLYQPVVSIIAFIIGSVYGWRVLMPKSIRKSYEQESFLQRNKFLNNMTQILTDDSKTLSQALNLAKMRSKGEFRDVMTRLEAGLFGADIPQIQDMIGEVSDKYQDDVIFVQYMEQLETAAIEGRTNIDTLKDIKVYHNQMKKKQEEYEKRKQHHAKEMKTMMLFITIFIFAISFSFGFKGYLSAFAHHSILGWLFGIPYLGLLWHLYHTFMTYMFDDSVVSMK